MLELQKPNYKRNILDDDLKYWPKERLEQRVAFYAKHQPNKIAVIDPWKTLTYYQLDNMINDVAITMRDFGIQKNSVVMIQLPNIVESMVAFHASLRCGAVVLPVTPIYRKLEINSILKQVKPDMIFAPTFFKKNDYVAMYRTIEKLKNTHIIGVSIPGEESTQSKDFINWDDFIQNPLNSRLPEREYDSEEYSLLMFTSGTTSIPKGVLHNHGTLGVAISTFDGVETTDLSSIFLVASPVTHITGVVVGILGPMKLGATSVLMPTWDAAECLRIIDKYKCSYIMASTPFLSQLIEARVQANFGLETLSYFSCGGADVSEFLLNRAKNILPSCTFSRIYGSTEAPGISKFRKGFSETKRYSRDGRPSHPCKAKIKKQSLLSDGSGELEVYGPQLFMRYIDYESTVNSFDQEWFSTGDLALFDEDGFIIITGREKDIIIRGGENFSAKEIEDILITHPAIKEVTVVGVKDEVMGERACAFVVMKKGFSPIQLGDLTQILANESVAKQKWPERLEIVPTLPYTHSGKLQKYLLREQLNLK